MAAGQRTSPFTHRGSVKRPLATCPYRPTPAIHARTISRREWPESRWSSHSPRSKARRWNSQSGHQVSVGYATRHWECLNGPRLAIRRSLIDRTRDKTMPRMRPRADTAATSRAPDLGAFRSWAPRRPITCRTRGAAGTTRYPARRSAVSGPGCRSARMAARTNSTPRANCR